jgi:hypothetical protein
VKRVPQILNTVPGGKSRVYRKWNMVPRVGTRCTDGGKKVAPEVKRGALKGGALEMVQHTVVLEVQHGSRNSKGRGGTGVRCTHRKTELTAFVFLARNTLPQLYF